MFGFVSHVMPDLNEMRQIAVPWFRIVRGLKCVTRCRRISARLCLLITARHLPVSLLQWVGDAFLYSRHANPWRQPRCGRGFRQSPSVASAPSPDRMTVRNWSFHWAYRSRTESRLNSRSSSVQDDVSMRGPK